MPSAVVVGTYVPLSPQLKTGLVLKHNIDALLQARNQTRKELAQWCRRSESWISKIFQEGSKRDIPTRYLDRIAEFFGLLPYQLLGLDISPGLDRRRSERRRHGDRRVAHGIELARRQGLSPRDTLQLATTRTREQVDAATRIAELEAEVQELKDSLSRIAEDSAFAATKAPPQSRARKDTKR